MLKRILLVATLALSFAASFSAAVGQASPENSVRDYCDEVPPPCDR
jgi:hypothetical protein